MHTLPRVIVIETAFVAEELIRLAPHGQVAYASSGTGRRGVAIEWRVFG